ncbi:bifunctional 4-hydroxy-2-oxoglutarate aldolase/2-dehydro-3-deoxy-phosphogluconate aldolase [Evansella halocellulosilytica]|uniref:bifunctional 4-hydroxy-2-oxoglutarate aldolase/2-dehydro-3-deoxy-phosphogluconate aldolase n=1 Tax=Evansella halocellulosilytica TaxID=2011013 RepID=UPI000BB7DF78|nr:bifunctional 4-hydroxy-2-oxoglutarate aldolase/2-dehydro-3-deoxy-phosphogluconate aldolase [Evansella halocellulosilytica]
MKETNVERLQREKLVAIIRGISYESGEPTAQALLNGGISLLEVTLNTDGALKMISNWKEKFGERACIGAGTVLDLNMAKDAVSAGAEYLVSPNLDERVIDYGISKGVDVWPGSMTPTEVVRAYQAGATAVKLFPAGTLGIQYFKDIRGPLNHIPMMVTGGVNLDNMKDFLSAGAIAVGLGGNLVHKQLIHEKKFDEITNLARQFTEKVKGE